VSEAQVVERAAGADFPAFFRESCPRMLAQAIMMCGNRQDAEDAVQEAYTEALRRWDRVGGLDSPAAWVHRVMRQRVWRAVQRRDRARPVGLAVPVPEASTVEQAAEARAVLGALVGLPGRQRAVLVLHCLFGLSHQEIADQLGIRSTGTVASNLFKARQSLHDLLGTAGERPRPGDPLVTPAGRPVTPLAVAVQRAGRWLRDGVAGDREGLERVLGGVVRLAAARGAP
jgi:RNA polymerase sigma factor (sigma-70 family)